MKTTSTKNVNARMTAAVLLGFTVALWPTILTPMTGLASQPISPEGVGAQVRVVLVTVLCTATPLVVHRIHWPVTTSHHASAAIAGLTVGGALVAALFVSFIPPIFGIFSGNATIGTLFLLALLPVALCGPLFGLVSPTWST